MNESTLEHLRRLTPDHWLAFGLNHVAYVKPVDGQFHIHAADGTLVGMSNLDVGMEADTDCVFTFTVDDAARVLSAMSGPDPLDATTMDRPAIFPARRSSQASLICSSL